MCLSNCYILYQNCWIIVGSWKNDARVMENQGKIMEFDSGKALGTLYEYKKNWSCFCTYFGHKNDTNYTSLDKQHLLPNITLNL